MRKIVLTLLALCLLYAVPSNAADAQPAGLKAGFVEIDRIMNESDPAKETRKMMENKYRKEEESLKKSGESLQSKAKALKNPKVSDEKKAAYIKEYQSFQQKRGTLAQKQQEDLLKFQQEMVELVYAASANVAKAKGVDFITDARTIFYANKDLNMTEAVMAEVNKLYKEKPKPAAEEQKESKEEKSESKSDKDSKSDKKKGGKK